MKPLPVDRAFNPLSNGITGWERKVHVTPSVDLYSGQIPVFSMTLITVCVLSSV